MTNKWQFWIDRGGVIRVAIRVDKTARRAVIDFTGTSNQSETNFNAPKAVCRAAVLYVFRCLVNDDIPLNDGCLEPLHLIIPEGSLLNPRYPAAVVAGNVETSQAITAALLGATAAALRRIKFLEPMTAAILSNSRKIAPYGLAGGEDGQAGHNMVIRIDGSTDTLTAADQTNMAAGDIFVIETPGGGGFGKYLG